MGYLVHKLGGVANPGKVGNKVLVPILVGLIPVALPTVSKDPSRSSVGTAGVTRDLVHTLQEIPATLQC